MSGHLDITIPNAIAGWYYNPDGENIIDIYINGQFYHSHHANNYKSDLEELGIVPDGKAGFRTEATLKFCDVVNIYEHKSNIQIAGSPKLCLINDFVSLDDALTCEHLSKYDSVK